MLPASETPQSKIRSAVGARAARFAFLCICLLFVAAGSVWVMTQIEALKRELETTRREFAALKDQLARAEQRASTSAETGARLQAQVSNEARNRGGAGDAPVGTFVLTRDEIQLVRDFIRLPPAPPGATPMIVQGAVVPVGLLSPLPTQISDKIPKLTGARFPNRSKWRDRDRTPWQPPSRSGPQPELIEYLEQRPARTIFSGFQPRFAYIPILLKGPMCGAHVDLTNEVIYRRIYRLWIICIRCMSVQTNYTPNALLSLLSSIRATSG